jgi:hypothetical protein
MYPNVFQIATASPAVLSALGSNPTRFWPFGKVPQNETRPYAFHQLIYGNPDNSLSCVPSEDLFGIQIDAYAKTVSDTRSVAEALRDAFEAQQYPIVGYNGEDWDQPTGLYRVSFTVEFWTERSS